MKNLNKRFWSSNSATRVWSRFPGKYPVRIQVKVSAGLTVKMIYRGKPTPEAVRVIRRQLLKGLRDIPADRYRVYVNVFTPGGCVYAGQLDTETFRMVDLQRSPILSSLIHSINTNRRLYDPFNFVYEPVKVGKKHILAVDGDRLKDVHHAVYRPQAGRL